MASLEVMRSGQVCDVIPETSSDDECLKFLRGFSLPVGGAVRLGSVNSVVDPENIDADVEVYLQELGVLQGSIAGSETRSERPKKEGSWLLHPFAAGLRGQVHNLLAFLQHRPSHTTAA